MLGEQLAVKAIINSNKPETINIEAFFIVYPP